MYPILRLPGPTPVGHLVLMLGNEVAVVANGMLYTCPFWDFGPLPPTACH